MFLFWWVKRQVTHSEFCKYPNFGLFEPFNYIGVQLEKFFRPKKRVVKEFWMDVPMCPSWSNPIILRSFVFGLQDLVPKTRTLRALDWKGPSTEGSTVNRGGYQSLEPLSCVGLEYQNFDIKLGGECTTDCNSGGNCLHPTASRLELQRCRFDNA